jgi:hypothetical protein
MRNLDSKIIWLDSFVSYSNPLLCRLPPCRHHIFVLPVARISGTSVRRIGLCPRKARCELGPPPFSALEGTLHLNAHHQFSPRPLPEHRSKTINQSVRIHRLFDVGLKHGAPPSVRNHVSIRPRLALGRLPVPSELAMEQGLAAAQRGSEWLPGCQVAANQVDVRA